MRGLPVAEVEEEDDVVAVRVAGGRRARRVLLRVAAQASAPEAASTRMTNHVRRMRPLALTASS